MKVKLVFLGRLEEQAGYGFADISPNSPLDWPGLLERLGSELAEAVGSEKVKVALNGALVADKYAITLNDGDEIAFLPPVSGG